MGEREGEREGEIEIEIEIERERGSKEAKEKRDLPAHLEYVNEKDPIIALIKT